MYLHYVVQSTDAYVNISFWIGKDFDNTLYDPNSEMFSYTANAVTNKVSCYFKFYNFHLSNRD